jgi:hypothetical protein
MSCPPVVNDHEAFAERLPMFPSKEYACDAALQVTGLEPVSKVRAPPLSVTFAATVPFTYTGGFGNTDTLCVSWKVMLVAEQLYRTVPT